MLSKFNFKINQSLVEQIYGPLSIPSFCWPIIDTFEFQRLRNISQLGVTNLVYIGCNHTKFEHSLATAHLTYQLLNNLLNNQPELPLKEEHVKAAIIASLCHDLGTEPFGHIIEQLFFEFNSGWNHRDMSQKILKFIIKKYKIDIDDDIIEAACCFIMGKEYKDYPKYLPLIVRNDLYSFDVERVDILNRDTNRSINIRQNEFERLLSDVKIINDTICWKLTMHPQFERYFLNFHHINSRVYVHKVSQAIGSMFIDMLRYFMQSLENLEQFFTDPSIFCKYDDRVLAYIEFGEYGDEAKELQNRVYRRDIYKHVGSVKLTGDEYSPSLKSKIIDQVKEANKSCDTEIFRVFIANSAIGPKRDKSPIFTIPFYCGEKLVYLSESDVTSIDADKLFDIEVSFYATSKNNISRVSEYFIKWQEQHHPQKS